MSTFPYKNSYNRGKETGEGNRPETKQRVQRTDRVCLCSSRERRRSRKSVEVSVSGGKRRRGTFSDHLSGAGADSRVYPADHRYRDRAKDRKERDIRI